MKHESALAVCEPQTLQEMHANWKAAQQRMKSAGLTFEQQLRDREREVREREREVRAREERLREEEERRRILRLIPSRVMVPDIIRACADFYGVSRRNILSHRRTQAVARPRQVAMFLAKTMTLCTLPQIGGMFGRDHTTVIYAVRKIEGLQKTDALLAADVQSIRAGLEEDASRVRQMKREAVGGA